MAPRVIKRVYTPITSRMLMRNIVNNDISKHSPEDISESPCASVSRRVFVQKEFDLHENHENELKHGTHFRMNGFA